MMQMELLIAHFCNLANHFANSQVENVNLQNHIINVGLDNIFSSDISHQILNWFFLLNASKKTRD